MTTKKPQQSTAYSPALHFAIQRAADSRGISFAAMVRLMASEWLREHPEE